jgi:TonB family protein
VKTRILAAATAISAAAALGGCNQSPSYAGAQQASQPQDNAPIVATGKLAETDSKNSGWWAAENGANDCSDESGPAQVIKLVSYNRDRYTTQDSIDERGDIIRTDIQVPAENMQITFYRQKSACMASIQAPQDIASADEAKYGGESAAPAQAAPSAPTQPEPPIVRTTPSPNSEQDSASPRYLENVQRLVRPKIIWDGATEGLETVIEVHCSPSGTLLSATIKSGSGNAGWDSAALNAVQRSDPMPLDTNGHAPATLTITVRPAG